MFYYALVGLYILGCLLLLTVVLLQQGKGGDIASAFGGGGSQTAFGARAGATVLTKATAVLGAFFMVGAIALSIIGRGGPGTLMRGVSTPPPTHPIVPQPGPVEAPQGALPDAAEPPQQAQPEGQAPATPPQP